MMGGSGSLPDKVRGLIRLCRVELPFAAGICVLIGELVALGTWPTIGEMGLGFAAVFLISAATLVLNDYFDLAADRINAPDRPLPAGLVTPGEVIGFSLVLAALGLIASARLGVPALLVAVGVGVVGFLYNWRFKRTGLLGNGMVSFSVGMTFVFGGVAVGRPFQRLVWFFAVIGMLIDLGEEIAADALDMEGDRAMGSRSLALLWGREPAIRLGAGLFLVVVAWTTLPFWLGWLGWAFAVPLAVMDLGILVGTARLVMSRETAARRRYVRWIYLSGLVGMLVFLVVRMVG
jgi:geranylgeranylglycerol-phosphate geranylgeranyltransferase